LRFLCICARELRVISATSSSRLWRQASHCLLSPFRVCPCLEMALTNSECGVCFPQNPKSTFSLTCNALCAQKLWRAHIQIPYCMRKVLVSFFLVALAATLSVTIVAHTVCSIPLRLLTRKLQFALLFFEHAATMLGALNACTLLIWLDPFSIRKFALRLRFLANTTSLPDDAFFAFTLGDQFAKSMEGLSLLHMRHVRTWFATHPWHTLFPSTVREKPLANDSWANHWRHLVHLYGVPCSSNLCTHALQSGSSAFVHCFAPNSSLNLTLKHGPMQVVFGVCLSSTAFQSMSSPRNNLSNNAGPSGSPFVNTSRSKFL
jgi:hypothetical protein